MIEYVHYDNSAETASTCGGGLSLLKFAAGEMGIIMNRKLISLLLCAVMILGVFTACSKKDETDENATTTTTLTMLVVTEEKVNYTEAEYAALSESEKIIVDRRIEQYAAVGEELSQITKAKFKTKLDILYYTEDEYYDILEKKLEKTGELVELTSAASKEYKRFQRSEKKNGITDEVQVYENFIAKYPQHADYIDPPKSKDDEVEVDPSVDVYPDAAPDQADIVFIGSYDKYLEYIENGWLAQLDTPLKTGVAKKLTSYVYPAFLSAAKTESGYYAIPNNTVVGEYTALLVNKEICDKYSDISQIKDLSTSLDLVRDVAKYETDIDPVWCDSYRGYTNVHFWSVDYTSDADGVETFEMHPERFSVLGATYHPNYNSKIIIDPFYYSFGSILRDESFVAQLKALKTLEFEGYYGAEGSERDFAVGVIKGSGKDIEEYCDKYYSVILEYPVATQEDLFKSMFAVSSYTENVDRCMEIITHLNTNSQFRNLLQYGIKGTNYELDDDECATRKSDNLYVMDVFKTGNMFVAYPDADNGMNQATWEYAKKQDLDVVTNPTLGFELKNEDLPDLKNIDVVNKASKEFEEKIAACKTMEELESTIDLLIKTLEGGDATYFKEIVQKAMLTTTEGIEYNFSVYALYHMWCKDMGYTS